MRDGHIRLGDAVAVFGMGAIGLFVVQLAKLAGAYPVIAVDPIPLRRDVALECGADLVLDPTACDAGLEIKLATDARGADVCVDYSGHFSALQAALRGVAYLGTIVAGAFPGSYPAGLDLGAEAHMNRPTIVFSRACSEPNPEYPNWDETRLFSVVWRLLCDGSLNSEASRAAGRSFRRPAGSLSQNRHCAGRERQTGRRVLIKRGCPRYSPR